MKKTGLIFLMLILGFAFLITSCNKDDDDDDVVMVDITQAQLDAATTPIKDFTGGNFAHGGPDGTTGDQTIRKVYGSTSNLSGTIAIGTIITKGTYAKKEDGTKGNLYVTFAMVKRESGYNSEAGDWEFIKMPADAAVDYTAHPNGMLPEKTNASLRGKLAGCIGCHASAAGGDYLFVND